MNTSEVIAKAESRLGDGLLAMLGKRLQISIRTAEVSNDGRQITLRFLVEEHGETQFVWNFNVGELFNED